uniref:PDEase domain-containing protein n=1 Tax=Gongylonema pulchrum TaxID=637853 RepID=A0A183DFJ9_9BILA
LNIPISTEAGMQLYERWVHQGISSIMSAVANQRAETLNEYERSRLYRCSKAAEDIHQHARCVIRVIDANPRPLHTEKRCTELFSLLYYSFPVKGRNYSELACKAKNHSLLAQKLGSRTNRFNKLLSERSKEPVGVSLHSSHLPFRTRRSVVSRKSVQLHTEYEHITPLGIIGKYLTKTVKIIKNKDTRSSSVSLY